MWPWLWVNLILDHFWARSKVMCVKRVYFGAPWWCEKGVVQMRRGGLWVSSSAWWEKGMMRKLFKNALRVFREIKERASVHCFCLAKPLGLHHSNFVGFVTCYSDIQKLHPVIFVLILKKAWLVLCLCSQKVIQGGLHSE